jgi:hypothetical protein
MYMEHTNRKKLVYTTQEREYYAAMSTTGSGVYLSLSVLKHATEDNAEELHSMLLFPETVRDFADWLNHAYSAAKAADELISTEKEQEAANRPIGA